MQRLLLLCTLFLSLAASSAARAAAHDEIRSALVFIETSGTAQEGDLAGLPDSVRTQGTGFVITSDGFILTSHHILDAHAQARSLRLTITGRFGDYQGETFPLTVVQANPFLDLVLLKARLRQGQVAPFAPLGLASDVPRPGTRLFTSGFPGATYLPAEGDMIDDAGTLPHLKQVLMSVHPGQSGSPVYLENGRVVGIVKGSLKDPQSGGDIPGKSLFVPIELADSLIGFLRVQALERQVLALTTAFPTAPEARLSGILGMGPPKWRVTDDPLKLGVRADEGICFLVGIWGDLDHREDDVEVTVDADQEYVLTGHNEGGGPHGAFARCLRF